MNHRPEEIQPNKDDSRRGLWWKIALPLVIGLTVIFLLFKKDFSLSTFSQIRFNSDFAIGMLFMLMAFAAREAGMALRFNALTSGKLSLGKSLFTTFMCEFTSTITPTSVGGSALSMVFMNREGVPLGRATTITLIILFLDNLFFTVFCPVVILLCPFSKLFNLEGGELEEGLEAVFWVAYAAMCVLTLVLFLGIFVVPATTGKFLTAVFSLKFLRRWKKKIDKLAGNMSTASQEVKNMNFSWWLKGFAATCLSWLGRFLVVNAVFYAIIPGSPQEIILARQFIVWALLMFSPTPGGSGISEWLFDKYYFDIIPSDGLVMVLALLWRLFSYYIYMIIGLFLLPKFLRIKKERYDNIPEC